MERSSRIYRCTACFHGAGPQFDESQWVRHVMSEPHQKKVSKPCPDEDECLKFIYVTGPDFSPTTVVTHFMCFGVVVDVRKHRCRNRQGEEIFFYFVEFADEKSAKIAIALRRKRVAGTYMRIEPLVPMKTAYIDFGNIEHSLMNSPTPAKQLEAFITLVSLGPEDSHERNRFLNALMEHFRWYSSVAMVYEFGSCYTQLGFRGSDVDLYVDFGFNPKEILPVQAQKEQIVLCVQLMRSFDGISQVIPIPHARVPIVQCFSEQLCLSVDLSFRSIMGRKNSDLILFYCRIDRRVSNVLMLLRWWAKSKKIIAKGFGFTSYAFAWLVLYALMNLPEDERLPSVWELQQGVSPDYVEKWNCAVNAAWRRKSDGRMTEFHLISFFFGFYANAQFGPYVLSPFASKAIPRYRMANPDLLGPEFEHLKKVTDVHRMPLTSHLCLQDPFTHNFNIARSVKRETLGRFVGKCKEAHEVCQLWFGQDEGVASLYPMIYLVFGDRKAREMCASCYEVPFIPRSDPPSLPESVFDIEVGVVSLAHLYARDYPLDDIGKYQQWWEDKVLTTLEEILTGCLFFDVWNFKDLDAPVTNHLEKFVEKHWKDFLAEEHATLNEIRNHEFEALMLALEETKVKERMFVSRLQQTSLGDDTRRHLEALLASAAEKIRTIEDKLASFETPIMKDAVVKLSVNEVNAAAVFLPEPVGPLERRSARAEKLLGSLQDVMRDYSGGSVVAAFLCEARFPTLLRNGTSPRMGWCGDRLFREKYCTAQFLCKLKELPELLAMSHPSGQFVVVICRNKWPAGLRIFVAAGPVIEGGTVSAENHWSSGSRLTNYVKDVLHGALDEEDDAASGGLGNPGGPYRHWSHN